MTAAPKTSRWVGPCYRCKREREIESRYTHGAQTLCDECAAKPHKRPSATGLDERKNLAVIQGGKLEVVIDDKGKLKLPPIPDDHAGRLHWLSVVFNLTPEHPIVGAEWQGQRGPDGQIALRRAGTAEMRFEPARSMNTPMKLIEAFTGRRHPKDGQLYAYKGDHCRQIAYVIESLCDTTKALSEAEEAAAIVGSFLHAAEAVEGHTTHGTPGQRYEAAKALSRRHEDGAYGTWRYLIDEQTGQRADEETGELIDQGQPVEYVIAVSDLSDAARRFLGSSLPRGWLDARMQCLGWHRIRLQGYGQPGRAGRHGPHARIDAYRGALEATESQPNDEEAVNT